MLIFNNITYYGSCNLPELSYFQITLPIFIFSLSPSPIYYFICKVQTVHPIGQFCGAKWSQCVAERSDVVRF